VVNLSLVGALALVGITAHSLGVLAAGADYLADAAAIGLALVALRVGGRHPRANALAALVNAGWLLVLSALVVAGALDRLARGSSAVHGMPILIVSSVAAGAMVATALMLGVDEDAGADTAARTGAAGPTRATGDGASLSVRAVLLDTAADAAAAAGVAIAGAIILVSGRFDWLDPAVALVIAVVVSYHAVRLLTDVRDAMRQPSPRTAPTPRGQAPRG
jgi:cobalt-zinc-cadmium efflux system protein